MYLCKIYTEVVSFIGLSITAAGHHIMENMPAMDVILQLSLVGRLSHGEPTEYFLVWALARSHI